MQTKYKVKTNAKQTKVQSNKKCKAKYVKSN